MADDDHVKDIDIYKAALRDDWGFVSTMFKDNPSLMTKRITQVGEMPLHIAVGTNSSHLFVEKLVKGIVARGENHMLFKGNRYGNNPLHFAAMVGNMHAIELLLEQDPDKTQTRVRNEDGNMPLQLAAWHGNKETLEYLLKETPDLLPNEEGVSPYSGVAGGDLITRTIMAGFYDVALDIIKKHQDIVFEKDSSKESPKTALEILAQKPESFASGRRLGLWGRFIYSLIPVMNNEGTTDHSKYIAGFWNALGYVVPTVKMIYDMKVNDNRINLLVKLICDVVIEKGNHKTAWKILGSAIVTAVKYGVHELIEECIVTYPFIIWYGDNEYRLPNQDQDQDPQPYKFNLFLEAIRHRQERVFNLVYQMSHHKVFAATQHDGKENALHIAGKLAPTHRLHVVTGAALQMQRELQWFQEVQKFITQLSYEEDLNNEKKTPRMLFSDEHKQLLIEGQQWMKDTASSCTVVAALIVTMAFAAAFTLPGGNQDDGIPMFLNFNTFMLFIISDAVALFSSSTSVLMFLGILTSRYAEADFLYALPKRLTIGLISLFISLAATMIAFSSALALMLKYKVTWIAAPLIIATSIPVCLFGLLQFPLLVELVKSTYGKSIFHQQNAQMIH